MSTPILALLFFLIGATGGLIQEDTNFVEVLDESSGEPSYYLIAHTANPLVNGNDNFQINLYISGAGNVTQSNIRVSIPPYIVKGQIVDFYSRDYYTYKYNGREYLIDVKYNNSKQYPLFSINPSDINYKRFLIINPRTGSEYKKLIGALDCPSYPNSPWIIDFTIANDAPAGDHEVIIDHYYKNKDQWYTQRERIKLHINHWYENDINQYLLAIVSVLTTVYMIYEFYKKLEWRDFLEILLLVLVSLMIILIYR